MDLASARCISIQVHGVLRFVDTSWTRRLWKSMRDRYRCAVYTVAKTFGKPADQPVDRMNGAAESKISANHPPAVYLHEDGPSTPKSVLLTARTTARTYTSTWNPIQPSQGRGRAADWIAGDERRDQGGNRRRGCAFDSERGEGRGDCSQAYSIE